MAVIFFGAIKIRLIHFDDVGKDFEVYRQAIEDFYDGRNPYEGTLDTFEQGVDSSNHGFAFLPGILHIFVPLHHYHEKTLIPMEKIYKYPILVADVLVGVLLVIYFSKKSKLAMMASVLFWFFNPYIIAKNNYTYMDPVTILFLMLGLMYLEEDDYLAGFFYAVSFGIKTFPIILFPLFFFRSKNKIKFILSFGLTTLAISLPFLSDPVSYLRSAILSHSERYVQGKPFLFNISYKLKIEIIRVLPFNFYTLMAILSGWVITSLEYLKLPIRKLKNFYNLFRNKYSAAILPFLCFYLFTPVLNKTYLLWAVSVFAVGMYELFQKKRVWYYVSLAIFYAFYFWYLSGWGYGLHVDYKYY